MEIKISLKETLKEIKTLTRQILSLKENGIDIGHLVLLQEELSKAYINLSREIRVDKISISESIELKTRQGLNGRVTNWG